MAAKPWRATQARGFAAACMLAVLAGCGGGSGECSEPVAPAAPAILLPSAALVATHVSLASEAGRGAAGDSFQWDLGDGTTSTLPNPAHAYLRAGSYTVKLTYSKADAPALSTRATLDVKAVPTYSQRCTGLQAEAWCTRQETAASSEAITRLQLTTATRGSAVRGGELVRVDAEGRAQLLTRLDLVASRTLQAGFVDAQVGFAVDNGLLLRTSDGGLNWELAYRDTDARTRATQLWITDNGLVIANYEYSNRFDPAQSIRRTVVSRNAGARWTVSTVFASAVAPEGIVWGYVGGRLCRSLDGGETCTAVAQPPTPGPRLQALAGGGLAVLGAYTPQVQPTLPYSLDNAASWQVASLQPTTPTRADESWLWADGVVRGSGTLWMRKPLSESSELSLSYRSQSLARSDDWGRSWAAVALPAPADAADLDEFTALGVADADTVYLMKATGSQVSYDGGRNWSALGIAGLGSRWPALTRGPGGVLEAAVVGGQRFWSTDQGFRWTAVVGAANGLPETGSTWFIDAQRGYALDVPTGALSETADGGAHWLDRGRVGPTSRQRAASLSGSLHFVSDQLGWLVDNGRLFRTRDGGRSWQPLTLPSAFADAVATAQFVDAQNGFLLVRLCNDSSCTDALQSTRDGGVTWAPVKAPLDAGIGNLVRWATPRSGVLANATGQAWFTDDAGATWQAANLLGADGAPRPLSGWPYRSTFREGGDGWLLTGEQLLRSKDQGRSWRAVTLPNPNGALTNKMSFIDSTTVVVFGYLSGVVASSRDGGNTWTAGEPATR